MSTIWLDTDADGPTVRPEVREVLLGTPAAEKACSTCGSITDVTEWPVEFSLDADRVAYSGRCPTCEETGDHVIVDPAGRW